MKNYWVRQLGENDKFIVSELRRRLLQIEFPQVQDPIQFNWGPTDRSSWVLGAFHQETLASAIRLEWVTTQECFENRLGILHRQLPLSLPVWITARAVTDPKYQRRGLHSILKMFCFIQALKTAPLDCLASHRADTARASALSQLGYHLHLLPALSVDPDENAPKSTLITRLDLKNKGATAIELIQKKYPKTLSEIKVSPELSHQLNLAELPFLCEP